MIRPQGWPYNRSRLKLYANIVIQVFMLYVAHCFSIRRILQSVALVASLGVAAAISSGDALPADVPGLLQWTLFDNDFDIDDLMALPVVIGSEPVAAVIQTQGYTEPEMAAPVVDILLHGISTGDATNRIPIVVGGRQQNTPDLSSSPWVPFFRSMLNRANEFLNENPKPWQPGENDYSVKISD